MNKLIIKDSKPLDYLETWEKMKSFTLRRTQDDIDQIWLLEHNQVFTLGYNGSKEHILQTSPIPIVHSDRGGNITFHGPGQLVCYLLLNIKKLNYTIFDLVSKTEQVIIKALQLYNLEGHLIANSPGVYINNEKICSLGYRVKRGFSYHGFALNINMDIEPFQYINPCGHKGLNMTQLCNFNKNLTLNDVKKDITQVIVKEFGYTNILNMPME